MRKSRRCGKCDAAYHPCGGIGGHDWLRVRRLKSRKAKVANGTGKAIRKNKQDDGMGGTLIPPYLNISANGEKGRFSGGRKLSETTGCLHIQRTI